MASGDGSEQATGLRAAGGQSSETLDTTGCISGRGTQKLRQGVWRACIELGIGTTAQPRDLLKGTRRIRVMPLVEHEGLDSQKAKFACDGTEIVNRLLHSITDIDEYLQWSLARLCPDMAEHPSDLGLTSPATDLRHEVGQRPRIGDPAGGAALAEAPEVDQLHREASGLT